MSDKQSRWKTTGKIAGLVVVSAGLCGALAALTIFVSPFAAAMAGCFVLWVALAWTIRGRRQDQQTRRRQGGCAECGHCRSSAIEAATQSR